MLTIPRLFVDQPLHAEVDVPGSAGQAHYLGSVIRRGLGDEVCVFNGRDGEWRARISALRRDRVGFQLESQLRPQDAEDDLWLLFALLKRDTTDLIVQKATELGASVIQPVITDRTNAARVNEARLLAIATEAAEQCERLTVPEVRAPCPLADMLGSWPADRPLFAAIERSGAAPIGPFSGPCALLVGPEGGFSPAELDVLRRYQFVVPVTLGPRVLRAETACLAGLALLRSLAGR
jgi:16S rRNA (uracil1498-N3)-methyltransferase